MKKKIGIEINQKNKTKIIFFLKAIAKLTASYIKKHLPSMHKTHTGLSDAQAEIEYLKVSGTKL